MFGQTACPLAAPSIQLEHTRPLPRPAGVLPWSDANLSGLTHTSRFLFSPRQSSPDGWFTAIRASQFPENCGRYLVIEDDLDTAGVGWTASMLNVALAFAVRDRRVLVEKRVNSTWGHRTGHQRTRDKRGHGLKPRWCDRPPFTHQCFFQPWTHCHPTAQEIAGAVVPSAPKRYQLETENVSVVLIKLTWVQDETALWMGQKRLAVSGATFRLLFQPRSWVVTLAKCVMGEQGLQPRSYFSVHIRESAEKAAEIRRLRQGFRMPRLVSYFDPTSAVAKRLQQHKIWVQTASPRALANFSTWAQLKQLAVSYTDNRRSEHDTWGGWSQDAGADMTDSIVAAVNAYIGRQASAVISPANSAWTNYLLLTAGFGLRAYSYCCRCAGHSNMNVIPMAKEATARLGEMATLLSILGPRFAATVRRARHMGAFSFGTYRHLYIVPLLAPAVPNSNS